MTSCLRHNQAGGRRRRKIAGTKRRMYRGGASSCNGSAASYELSTVGTADQQWNNTFIRGGPFSGSIQNLAGTQPSVVAGAIPSAANLKLIQSAGGHMKKMGGKSRSRKGGNWGMVVSKAAVPFGLWAAQNMYGKRYTRRNSSRNYRSCK